VPEFPEHRPQCVQLSRPPGDTRGAVGDLVGDPQLVQVAARPRSFSIRSISGSSSSRNARRWAATVVWSNPG